MDIKAKIEELVAKIKGDKGLLEKFKADPAGTIKGLLPVELSEDTLKHIADGVKAKLNLESIAGTVSGAADKIKGMLKK